MAGYVAGQIDTPQAKLPSFSTAVEERLVIAMGGAYGFDLLTVAATYNLSSGWCRLYALADASITVVGNGTGIDAAFTLKAGQFLNGAFTQVVLASGTLVAYLARERNSTVQ